MKEVLKSLELRPIIWIMICQETILIEQLFIDGSVAFTNILR